jgi:hypothetical protein
MKWRTPNCGHSCISSEFVPTWRLWVVLTLEKGWRHLMKFLVVMYTRDTRKFICRAETKQRRSHKLHKYLFSVWYRYVSSWITINAGGMAWLWAIYTPTRSYFEINVWDRELYGEESFLRSWQSLGFLSNCPLWTEELLPYKQDSKTMTPFRATWIQFIDPNHKSSRSILLVPIYV